jgi:hypothetical protein
MKLILTEKQYKGIIFKLLEQSESEPVSSQPETGTSSAQAGGKGYPQVGKWESGVTRGSSNQIGVTKWSDVVGSKLTRGKGNPLKEQNDLAFDRRYGTAAAAEKSNRENRELVSWIAKETNWDAWGQWALMGGSILAACFIPGAQGLWISIGLDVIASADLYFNKKDSYGAGIAGILAFIPLIGKSLKIGTVSVETAQKLAKYLAPLKTEEQVLSAISKLTKQEQYIVQQVLKQDPNTLNNIIKGIVMSKVATKQEALRVATQINNLLKSGKLPKASAAAFYKNLNLQRFGFDILASGFVMYGGLKYKEKKEEDKMINRGSNEKIAKPEDFED